MKQLLLIAFCAALTSNAIAQNASIYQKGELSPANVHHTGDVWLAHLGVADSVFNYNLAVANFAPGARLDWHIHPGGQRLLVTEGVGYYQERNKPLQTVHKGEIIKCEPGVEHWHGATPDSAFAYLAITAPQPTKWLEKVADEAYSVHPKSPLNTMTTEAQIISLSKDKWQWMSDKNVDQLSALFDDKSVFVHMGGSWGKDKEIDIIKTGGIHYKKADIHEVAVNVIGNTAILLSKITLLAVVGGNEVTNPFIVTEVYIMEDGKWKLGSLSFTKQLAP